MKWTFAADFLKSKTTQTSLVTIVVAAGSAFLGTITWMEAGIAIFAALQVMFVRDAIVKQSPPPSLPPNS